MKEGYSIGKFIIEDERQIHARPIRISMTVSDARVFKLALKKALKAVDPDLETISDFNETEVEVLRTLWNQLTENTAI